jgi:parallel beta-helix repeat protein
MRTINLVFFLLVINYFEVHSQVFVKSNATGLNDGTSWQNAYTDLSIAINNTSSGEIWVAAGIYKPSTDLSGNTPTDNRLKTFRLKENLAIYGGFTGNEEQIDQRDWKTNQTVLSGDIGVENNNIDNCIHVVSAEFARLNQQTILDGVTVKHGYSYSQYNGAGIYVNQTSGGTFIVRNCIIENNSSYRGGGGLYVFNSNPIIENNIFRNNQAFEGGAMYLHYSNALVRNNEITNNKADNYANVSSSSLSGGGVYIGSYSSPHLTNNVIKNNYAKYEGGGASINSNYHTVFEGNLIIGNTSRDGGGVFLDFSQTYFLNNVFARNTATQYGGAMYMDYTPGPKLINNSIILNTANQAGGGLYLFAANATVLNSIIYLNTSPIGSQAEVLVQRSDWFPRFKYCNIEKGILGIHTNLNVEFQNNLDTTPMFANVNGDDFSITALSALIDKGTIDSNILGFPWNGSNGEAISFPTVDISGDLRVYNDQIDIGASESQKTRQFSPTGIHISSKVVDQSASIGTPIGILSTTDTDSQNFAYELKTNTDCFEIKDDTLLTKCSLRSFDTSPIVITIRSTDDQGWSIDRSLQIELLNIITELEDQRNYLSIYPNPTNGFVRINGEFSNQTLINLTTVQGELLYSAPLDDRKIVDLSSLSTGIYFIIVFDFNRAPVRKRIVKY